MYRLSLQHQSSLFFFRADQLNIVSAKCVKQSLKNVCKILRHAHGLMAAEKVLSRLARHYIFWPFIMRNFEIVIHAINFENIYVRSPCLANNLQVFVANLWITSLWLSTSDCKLIYHLPLGVVKKK